MRCNKVLVISVLLVGFLFVGNVNLLAKTRPKIQDLESAPKQNESNKRIQPQGGGSGGTSQRNDYLNVDSTKLTPLRSDLGNDKTLDRINVVFVYSDKIPSNRLNTYQSFVADNIDKKQLLLNADLIKGFLELEPIKSQRTKFNFWNYNEPYNDLNYQNLSNEISNQNNTLGLKNVAIVFVSPWTGTVFAENRSNANYANIEYTSDTDHTITKYYPDRVNTWYVESNTDGSISNYQIGVLNHELGHSLFGLGDEYSEFGSTEGRVRYPNCAPDQATAESWWGTLAGQTDAFTSQVFLAEFPSAQSWYNYIGIDPVTADPSTYTTYQDALDYQVNQTKVGYVKDGCFSGYNDPNSPTKPTLSSLMSSDYSGNVSYGLVNGRHINTILNQYSGTSTIIPKTAPSSVGYVNFQFDYDQSFDKANCTITVTPTARKLLKCLYPTRSGRLLSELRSFDMKTYSQTGTSDEIVPVDLNRSSKCKSVSNIVTCDSVDITDVNPNTNIRIGLNYGDFYGNKYGYSSYPSIAQGDRDGTIKFSDLAVIDTSAPTISVRDPYSCGGAIFGNVSDNQGVGNVREVVVSLTKTGESNPKYTFKPTIAANGDYSLAIQSTNQNEPLYVESGQYIVSYFASDLNGNVTPTQSYSANIKKLSECPSASIPPIKPSILIRTGGIKYSTNEIN